MKTETGMVPCRLSTACDPSPRCLLDRHTRRGHGKASPRNQAEINLSAVAYADCSVSHSGLQFRNRKGRYHSMQQHSVSDRA